MSAIAVVVPARPPRWPWMVAAAALACVTLAQLVPSQSVGPLLLIAGIDAGGWTYLLRAAALALGTLAVLGLLFVVLRRRDSTWAHLLTPAAFVVGGAWCLVGGGLTLFTGAVILGGTEYRTVGSVDGHPVVVQKTEVLNGAAYLDAGQQDGIWLALRGTTTTLVPKFPLPLSRSHLEVGATSTVIVVRYRFGSAARDAGEIRMPRKPQSAA